MEKMISVMQRQVKDLAGLYVELPKQSFAVNNVGSDQAGTYIYLDEREHKDPTALVEQWVSKPAPVPTKADIKKRQGELEKLGAHRMSPASLVTMMSGKPDSPAPTPATEPVAPSGSTIEANLLPDPEVPEGEKKPGFFKGLLKKIFS